MIDHVLAAAAELLEGPPPLGPGERGYVPDDPERQREVIATLQEVGALDRECPWEWEPPQ
jgi:hypothetical protein